MKETVLILEDDVAIALQWQKALQNAGFDVLVTHDADSAIEVFTSNDINVCIIDFMIREGGVPTANGGVKFLNSIDSKARATKKIIGVSGLTQGWPAIDAKPFLLTFGAQIFLEKPIDTDLLIKEINNLHID